MVQVAPEVKREIRLAHENLRTQRPAEPVFRHIVTEPVFSDADRVEAGVDRKFAMKIDLGRCQVIDLRVIVAAEGHAHIELAVQPLVAERFDAEAKATDARLVHAAETGEDELPRGRHVGDRIDPGRLRHVLLRLRLRRDQFLPELLEPRPRRLGDDQSLASFGRRLQRVDQDAGLPRPHQPQRDVVVVILDHFDDARGGHHATGVAELIVNLLEGAHAHDERRDQLLRQPVRTRLPSHLLDRGVALGLGHVGQRIDRFRRLRPHLRRERAIVRRSGRQIDLLRKRSRGRDTEHQGRHRDRHQLLHDELLHSKVTARATKETTSEKGAC